jgi:hypothetical protein
MFIHNGREKDYERTRDELLVVTPDLDGTGAPLPGALWSRVWRDGRQWSHRQRGS